MNGALEKEIANLATIIFLGSGPCYFLGSTLCPGELTYATSKKKTHLQSTFGRGYVSSQEGKPPKLSNLVFFQTRGTRKLSETFVHLGIEGMDKKVAGGGQVDIDLGICWLFVGYIC